MGATGCLIVDTAGTETATIDMVLLKHLPFLENFPANTAYVLFPMSTTSPPLEVGEGMSSHE